MPECFGIDEQERNCSGELMTPEQEIRRAQLERILAKPCPLRKPGARTRTWERERRDALEELRKMQRGEWEPDWEGGF